MEMKDVLKKAAREKQSHTGANGETCDGYQTGCQSLGKTGETQPNTDTLKLLSQEFEVSVNTLLALLASSFVNAVECHFVYLSKESLLDYLVEHMPNPDNLGVDDRRAQFNIYLSQLKHWK